MSDKIKVEFELDVDDVMEQIKPDTKGKSISLELLKELSKNGPIKASDLLDEGQFIQVLSLVSKSVAKSVYKLETGTIVGKSIPKIYPKGNPRIIEKVSPKVQPRMGTKIVEMNNPRSINIHNVKDPDKPIK